MGDQAHWERAYGAKTPDEQSWFQPRPELSLELIRQAGCDPSARIIDVGGGASHLTAALLDAGYQDVTVLDIAPAALDLARLRLGPEAASAVHWIVADITATSLPGPYDLWHDRAVFHFLTEANDRRAYVHTLRASLRRGAFVIIATFAEDGPTRCSGLPVVRYDPQALLAELGAGFELRDSRREMHRTPAGRDQSFVYCLFQLAPSE